METPAQGVAGYYIWEIPGKPLAVHLHLDVIDGLRSALLRGFGTLPKRGAEVGGILLGSIEPITDLSNGQSDALSNDPGNPAIVRVEDFELVPCDYKRGPSYLFTDQDRPGFESACERWQSGLSRPAYAVGYFRSDTRDAMTLEREDIELMDRHFPGSSNVALLIKPFVSKASVGGFFFRQAGVFPSATPLEFEFRGRELAGEEDSPETVFDDRDTDTPPVPLAAPANTANETPSALESYQDRVNGNRRSFGSRRLGTWAWIPMSFIFLLLGVLLGFQAALTMGTSRLSTEDVSLSLSAKKAGDNLSVKWNGRSPAVRMAPRGVLEIEDGDLKKSVDLDAAQLLNGSVLYRNMSNSVRFRLVVNPSLKTTVTETLEWHQ